LLRLNQPISASRHQKLATRKHHPIGDNNSGFSGIGSEATGWNFELSDPSRPTIQRCYYEEAVAGGVSASQTLAFDGAPRPPSALTKLSFDFDGALANCSWFSGS
jgi:hypothetical protein